MRCWTCGDLGPDREPHEWLCDACERRFSMEGLSVEPPNPPPAISASALADSIALHAGPPEKTTMGDDFVGFTVIWAWRTPALMVRVVDVEGDAPEIWTDGTLDSYRPATLAEADRLGRMLAAARRRTQNADPGADDRLARRQEVERRERIEFEERGEKARRLEGVLAAIRRALDDPRSPGEWPNSVDPADTERELVAMVARERLESLARGSHPGPKWRDMGRIESSRRGEARPWIWVPPREELSDGCDGPTEAGP